MAAAGGCSRSVFELSNLPRLHLPQPALKNCIHPLCRGTRSLTVAVESGSQRVRQIVNKKLATDEIVRCAEAAQVRAADVGTGSCSVGTSRVATGNEKKLATDEIVRCTEAAQVRTADVGIAVWCECRRSSAQDAGNRRDCAVRGGSPGARRWSGDWFCLCGHE